MAFTGAVDMNARFLLPILVHFIDIVIHYNMPGVRGMTFRWQAIMINLEWCHSWGGTTAGAGRRDQGVGADGLGADGLGAEGL